MSEKFSKPSASRESKALTASTAAYRLTHLLNAMCAAHGIDRFPIDVSELAIHAHHTFGWSDPISEVKSDRLGSFEGALYPNEDRTKWLLLYNSALRSAGRVRFTQAHELGHYLLHRAQRAQFECSDDDMIDLANDEVDIESQADAFASNLLMPLDDFRSQMGSAASFEALAACAERYGTSLTATALRWLRYTSESAVLLVHNDGFIRWAVPSKAAFASGAYFKTRTTTIPIPEQSIAADTAIQRETVGTVVDATRWFPHAERGSTLREMKVSADHYDFVMTLLVLPRGMSVWKPREDAPE